VHTSSTILRRSLAALEGGLTAAEGGALPLAAGSADGR
jgi:hypothetical protein